MMWKIVFVEVCSSTCHRSNRRKTKVKVVVHVRETFIEVIVLTRSELQHVYNKSKYSAFAN